MRGRVQPGVQLEVVRGKTFPPVTPGSTRAQEMPAAVYDVILVALLGR